MRFFLVGFIFLTLSPVWAAAPASKLYVFRTMYSGEEHKSFESDKSGLGMELAVATKEPFLNYFTKGRLTTVSGTQEFDDQGIARDSSFAFYQSTFEVGATIYPMSRRGKGMNVYMGLSAFASYNYISLSSEDFANIKPSYQSMSIGYAGIMGVEWYVFGSSKWYLSFEASQRSESIKMVEQSQFKLDGFSVGLGIAW